MPQYKYFGGGNTYVGGVKLHRFGQPIELSEEDAAMAIYGGAALYEGDDHGFTEKELEDHANPEEHSVLVPDPSTGMLHMVQTPSNDFMSKKAAVQDKIRAMRESFSQQRTDAATKGEELKLDMGKAKQHPLHPAHPSHPDHPTHPSSPPVGEVPPTSPPPPPGTEPVPQVDPNLPVSAQVPPQSQS